MLGLVRPLWTSLRVLSSSLNSRKYESSVELRRCGRKVENGNCKSNKYQSRGVSARCESVSEQGIRGYEMPGREGRGGGFTGSSAPPASSGIEPACVAG